MHHRSDCGRWGLTVESGGNKGANRVDTLQKAAVPYWIFCRAFHEGHLFPRIEFGGPL